MDSCGNNNQEDQNWLAFSLSNQNYYATSSQPTNIQTQHHQNLCLFQHPSPGEGGHVVDNGGANNEHHHHHHEHELTFLGQGGGGGDSSGMLQVSLFPVAPPQKSVDASTFLGGFSCEQQMQVNAQQREEQRINQSDANNQQKQQLAVVPTRKAGDGFGHRTSIYRGVTRHRWTGRYEAHLWDNSCRREGQSRKGRQVYLGGYDKEEKAARAYDLAALKYWGPTATTNFPISDYEKELEEMKNMSRQEFVASLRRKSSGFSRGASIYRGVTRYNYNRGHHQHGRWQARIGRVAGNKDLYLGTFSTQEEAAEAYDIAAIKFRGLNAVTNFDISRYDVNSIISSNLPVGGMSNKPKSISDHSKSDDNKPLDTIKSTDQDLPLTILPHLPFPHHPNTAPTLNFATPIKPPTSSQNYDLPALAAYDHNQQGNAIEYGLGYGNDGMNEGYNGHNNDHVSEASGSGGNSWIVAQNLHSFQSPKPRLSVVQRAIFGIE